MKVCTLVPVLALLATATASGSHNHNQPVARQAHSRKHHSRQAEIVNALQARDRQQRDEALPRALAQKPKRTLNKRGAAGCRAKGQAATSTSQTTTSSTTSTAATTTSTGDIGANYNEDYRQGSSAVITTSSTTHQAATIVVAAAAAATSAAATTAAAAASSAAASSGSTSGGSTNSGANSGSLTPNGKKAGVSAGDTLGALGSHIGWWYNWAPTDEGTSSSSATFVSMLWGGGTADGTDASRLAEFKSLTTVPEWIIGPEEPDCATGSGSAGMSISDTASLWNSLMAPKGAAGSLLLSPSMCHQMAEDGWLATFRTEINRDFDILNLHINKNSMSGVKADLDYYYNKYNKPIWVTEFACVDDSTGFVPCTDQGEINQFISDIVDLFEADSRVYAYAYSNGYGLGDVWPMWSNGAMTSSGSAYLSAISKYH